MTVVGTCTDGRCVHVRDRFGRGDFVAWSALSPVDDHDQDQAEARAATADRVAASWSAYLGVDVTPDDVTNLCRISTRIIERHQAEGAGQ